MADTKFKKFREDKGLSQGQLAKGSGVSIGTIRAFDQGYRNINDAQFKTLVDLSLVLDVPISDMLTDEELIEKCKKIML